MIQDIVDKINSKVIEFPFLELSLLSFRDKELIIAASEDFSYFHNFEMRFKNVFTIIGNIDWKADTNKLLIQVIEGTEEAINLNKKYRVEIGFTVFKLNNEEGDFFYIIAENIELVDKVVKYYS
ncbi:hypothetical protein [Chitinophaga sancti]|uniref:Uncharacterized protein n=1 Tax=Chitinophaga sancti TaxID=1004 RepID=A0A1K1SC99_9BACT|nr:hypothetical protein [Chitinophaga sancti]WQD63601.1 hypothetical protein U0033_04280 [Chitinophaga sancti]WQG90774.1 hypothetical protein SR876_04640 [Chitinophaga sancti]SFW81976.1 hypothetical protein SAMN05661012_05174 [Chitinophaga sancti]